MCSHVILVYPIQFAPYQSLSQYIVYTHQYIIHVYTCRFTSTYIQRRTEVRRSIIRGITDEEDYQDTSIQH